MTAKQTNSKTNNTIVLMNSAIASSIANPIPEISKTDNTNNIPIIENPISIRNEAFNSFKRVLPSSLFFMKSIVFERKNEIHIANAAIKMEMNAGSKAIMISHTFTIIAGNASVFCKYAIAVKVAANINGTRESLPNCLAV